MFRSTAKGKKNRPEISWDPRTLLPFIKNSLNKLRARKGAADEKSYWWHFVHRWPTEQQKHLDSFIEGSYRFEPMNVYPMKDETLTVWAYADRLFVRALLYLIKPVFKHIISPQCLHLSGPAGVKQALDLTKKALEQEGRFRYFIRLDIRSYYASINRKILLDQTVEHFKDPRVLNYLDQIINIPTSQNGAIYTPREGIPRRSSISPFFGALYLSPLDRAFENVQGTYYLRFMDDIVLLCQTKRQFCKAKKRFQKILSSLRLSLSKHKTKMGPLTRGFHFLGIDFKVNTVASQETDVKESVAQTQNSKFHVDISLHERGCIRALDKVTVMKADAVHPAKVQSYLTKWSAWWHKTAPPILRSTILTRLRLRLSKHHPSLCWLVDGLLWDLSVNGGSDGRAVAN